MTQRFAHVMFTAAVRAVQSRMGSRGANERFGDSPAPARDRLGDQERAFIAARNSFYMASVSETGWPYVQHRGGPAGFLKVVDGGTIGFADYRGNRQYISVGNLGHDGRVSLILVDYPNRRRLKIIGHARLIDARAEPDTLDKLRDNGYDARVERAVVVAVEAFDWNCPQHLTPRFTEAEIQKGIAPLLERLRVAEEGAALAPIDALGNGPLELVVSGVRQLTPRIRGYELRRTDGDALPPIAAGAHLIVPVRLPDGHQESRAYSICSDPERGDVYEIAVLNNGNELSGSAAVHRDYALGLVLRCAMPGNAFPLHDDDRPALLVAGGIGITPLRAMAMVLKAGNRSVRMHYAARSQLEAAYAVELSTMLGPDFTLHAADSGSRLDCAAALERALPGTFVYVCGPPSLIDAVQQAARAKGCACDAVRFERFQALATTDDQPFDIVIASGGQRIRVEANETALEALERVGVAVPSSCRAGVCRTCVVACLAGSADHRDQILTDAERAGGAFATCVSRAGGTELVLDLRLSQPLFQEPT